MKTKSFIEKYKGKDKLLGRPVRLNRVKLVPIVDRDYAELIFWGDIHLGYPTANIELAQSMLDFALERKAHVLLMGDLIEAGLRDSIGDSNYRQLLNPQEQMEQMIEMLQPLAEAGLIIGMHRGNHEARIFNKTSIDVCKIMARILKVRYLGYSCWSLLSVNGIRYSLYSSHGKSGAKFKHTKLKAAIDQGGWINSDIFAMGHVHEMASAPVPKQHFDPTKNKIVTTIQHFNLTGCYVEWDDSYAQNAGYPITLMGSPKIKLYTGIKNVRASL